jgi:hypothetical protein
MTAKRFRVAFSFAGEKADFVGKVARILVGRFSEAAILYYKYHEAEFADGTLGLQLPDLYRDQSDLIVVVVCPNYIEKNWCGLEWRAIHGLLMNGQNRQIMLCRFEHALPQGLYENAGFVELDDKTPNQAATLILERLAVNEGQSKDHYTVSAPIATIPSRTTTPNTLPRLHSFYGRAEELKKIADALLPSARTWGVLIDGPGGMGKTSLAIRAAELVPPGQFKRILFLSAKDREMSADGERRLTGFVLPGYLEMLNEIARLLGQPDLAKSIESARARLVLEALEPEQALLILDNLESLTPEHRDQLFAFIGHLPQGCKAIVTSRRRTDVDARIIRLEKLDHDAALAFLGELATDRPLLARASEAQRVELYEETGGNPLLLRWIAGQLGKGRCRNVADALAFIRSAPPENDPLEFIFGDLLETFTDSETKALAALTFFTVPMEVKFIAELANLTKSAAQTALGDLASRALVIPNDSEENFSLVPMVADFLRRNRPHVIKSTGDRLADCADALIVENGNKEHDRFPVLEKAWDFILPAMPLLLAGSNARLQSVCNAIDDFLEYSGRWNEWLALSQEAEAKALAAKDFWNAGWRAAYIGELQYLHCNSEEVLACAHRAASHWQATHVGPREWSFHSRLLGLGYELAEDYPAAIIAYRESLRIRQTICSESAEVAHVMSELADAERLSGKLADAGRDYLEALRIAKTVEYREGVAMITGHLAQIALAEADWYGAEIRSREALVLSENIGRQELVARHCDCLAKALAGQGRQAEGLSYALRAVGIYTALHSPVLQAARKTLAEIEG